MYHLLRTPIVAATCAAIGALAGAQSPTAYILLSPRTAQPGPVQGILGRLHLDLAHLVVVPVNDQGSSIDTAIASFATIAASIPVTVHYQVLVQDDDQFVLNSLRELGEDPELGFVQVDDMQTCRSRALDCIQRAAGTGMAEGWVGSPHIVGIRPLYRPDVEGVAYFEFAVDQGGFVVASTGEHDVPIPNWSSVGQPRSAELQRRAVAQGRSVAKIYKVDALCYVGEDANGDLSSMIGELPQRIIGLPALLDENLAEIRPDFLERQPWRQWRTMKQRYAQTYRPMLRQHRDQAALRWQEERSGLDGSWSSWTTYTADGGTSEQPIYDQFTYGSCAVGCGPVAWAMLFCWGDYQAHDGNATWSARTGLYQTNGGTSGSATVAPLTMDSGVENVCEELNDHMGTWCIAGQGATWPSRMGDAEYYLAPRTGATCTSRGSDLGVHRASYRDDARNSIRDRETPAVIGVGFLSHYPVAYKYRWRSKTSWLGITTYDREFYINPGWGSSAYFEWTNASTFLVGELWP